MAGTRGAVLRVVGWTVAGVLAVGTAAGIGVAFAGPSATLAAAGGTSGSGVFVAAPSPSSSPSPSPSTSQSAPNPNEPDKHGPFGRFPHGRFGGLGKGFGRNLMHGEFVTKDNSGKTVTMVVQRGSVTAVSGNSISLKSEDGFTGTYAVNNASHVFVGGGPGALSGVKTGNQAFVVATKGSTNTATVLVVKS